MAASAEMIGAREALRLADAEPARAAELAASVTRDALRRGDQVSAAVAERAWGLAVRQVGDLDSAIVHLSRAVQLGGASGAWEVAGEARTTLAFAAPVMVALHELLAAGLPPAEALTTAQRRVDAEDDAACAAAACFVCMGAGFSAPLPPGVGVGRGSPGATRGAGEPVTRCHCASTAGRTTGRGRRVQQLRRLGLLRRSVPAREG